MVLIQLLNLFSTKQQHRTKIKLGSSTDNIKICSRHKNIIASPQCFLLQLLWVSKYLLASKMVLLIKHKLILKLFFKVLNRNTFIYYTIFYLFSSFC